MYENTKKMGKSYFNKTRFKPGGLPRFSRDDHNSKTFPQCYSKALCSRNPNKETGPATLLIILNPNFPTEQICVGLGY
jgi:hypothetical protein